VSHFPSDAHDGAATHSPTAAPADGWLDLGPGWLFDSIRDAVVVADAETGRIVLWNPFASELFGYSADEALAVPLFDMVDDLHETPEWVAARSAGSSRQTPSPKIA